jgi:hypothetical protein
MQVASRHFRTAFVMCRCRRCTGPPFLPSTVPFLTTRKRPGYTPSAVAPRRYAIKKGAPLLPAPSGAHREGGSTRAPTVPARWRSELERKSCFCEVKESVGRSGQRTTEHLPTGAPRQPASQSKIDWI